MATRLSYVLPIARQLLTDARRRLRRGGLAAGIPTPSEGNPLVIVAGAGRSGTSAVARVLHESGVRMGDELAAPSDANPDGYYEDLGILGLHAALLTELGMSSIWEQERWPWRSTVLAAAANHREEMEELVAKASDGWKDPRFSITMEAWLPLLPARPKLVVCLRSPHAYADSVIRVFGLVDRGAAERQWAKHYRRLLDVIRDYGLEATCVEYNALVEHPEETVATLAAFVGRELKPEYVDAPLRRFTRPVPEKYRRLYKEVLALGGGGAAVVETAAEWPAAIASERSALAEEEVVPTIDAYTRQVDDIDVQTQASKAVWTAETGLPRTKLTQFARLGLTMAEAMEQTRAAAAAYSSMLKDAQDTLRTLDPPPGFERYHELTERMVNYERMAAELMLAAVKGEAIDRRMLKEAIRSWSRHGRGSAVEKAQEQRQREYERALDTSGYLAARQGERYRRI